MTEKRKLVKWTNQDLKILREIYPVGGITGAYNALNGRHSRRSIGATAFNWGIRCEVPTWKLREYNSTRPENKRRYAK
jgi:hypothetical protein